MSETDGTEAVRLVASTLLRLAQEGATGTLTMWRGQTRKRLYLRRGQLVAAESDLREEALGEVLVALGLIGKSRLPQLLSEVRRRGQKMGAVVVELGWASADEVLGALGEQVRRRAKSCLRWPEPNAVFEASDGFIGSVIEYPHSIPPMVFSGLRESASFEELLPALEGDVPRLVTLLPAFEPQRAAFVALFGTDLLDAIAAHTPVRDLVLGADATTMLEAIDVLLASDLARLVERGRALALPGTGHGGRRAPLTPEKPWIGLEGSTAIDRIGAELAFHEGRAAFAGGNARAALEHLRRAVELRPDQAAYHAWLGSVLFHLSGTGALPEALDRLEHAVAVDPDLAEAHLLLADVLAVLGDQARARTHFEATLQLAPDQPEAVAALAQLLREGNDVLGLELLYRRLITALGDRAPGLRRQLWSELAGLYGGPLADPTMAARAAAMASSLPDS